MFKSLLGLCEVGEFYSCKLRAIVLHNRVCDTMATEDPLHSGNGLGRYNLIGEKDNFNVSRVVGNGREKEFAIVMEEVNGNS